MDIIEFFLCAIGLFYAFAGFVATRAGLTSYFVDRAIAAIGGGKPNKIELVQTYWLLVAATVIFAGGVTMFFLLDVAAWLFLASAVGQALYLFYVAPRFFDSQETLDVQGRRRSTNAFAIYVDWTYVAIPVALIAAQIGYVVWMLTQLPATAKSPLAAWTSGETLAPGKDPSQCTRIKVMADYCAHPLWALDEDLYGDFAPEALGLSPELTRDLNEWADAYTQSYDEDDPAVSRWTDEEHRAHAAQARPLAIRLAREKPDRTFFVTDPVVGVLEVRAEEEI
jgi:hypothetical protein